MVKRIFIIPYCHPDWAWTFTREWHEKRYILVAGEALETIRDHPEFRWYLDPFVTQTETILRSKPELYKELRKRIKEGKIAICGSYTNLRPTMTGEESQVRDLQYGKKIYKKLFPEADLSVYAGTVDVSVGHPQVPQLLKLAGYKYLRFWRPHVALTRKKVPLEFFWKGFDGSKILCSRGSYGGLCDTTDLYGNLANEVNHDRNLSATGIRWISRGTDDCRPLMTPYSDIPLPLFETMEKYSEKEGVSVKFATPQEFFKELERSTDQVPEVSGSLDPCDVCYNVGWGGSNGLFALRQENEINITTLETWLALVSNLKPSETFETVLEHSWKTHLLSCAHATQWLFEEDFNKLYSRALQLKIETTETTETVLRSLTGLIASGKTAQAVVFNPLPFEREEKVRMLLTFPLSCEDFSLEDAEGNAVPFQVIDKNENAGKLWEFDVIAKVKVPACGYNSVSTAKTAKKRAAKGNRAVIEFEGSDVVSVKANKKKYSANAENSFANIRLYHVDTTKGALHAGPVTSVEQAKWDSIRIAADGALFTLYRSNGSVGSHRITRDIIAWKDEPVIDIGVEVKWGAEDGFIALETPILSKEKICGDTPFAVEEKDMEKEPFLAEGENCWENIERQRKNLFYAKSFVSAGGVSYLNCDASHYYLLTENSVANILVNSVTKLEGWERFVNKAMRAEGTHKFSSRLIFHKGNWKNSHIAQKAQAFARKPKVIPAGTPSKGALPPSGSFVSISAPNIIITGFYKEGKNFIMRFYETEGRKTKTAVKLPFASKKAVKTDLLGNKMGTLGKGRILNVSVKPWEIVTLQLQPGSSRRAFA